LNRNVIIFKVSEERIYREYQRYIQTGTRHVDWYLDENLVLHIFVITDLGFGYYFSNDASLVNAFTKSMCVKDGAVLGVYEQKSTELKDDINRISNKLELGILRDLQA
jgi:hypothetical protein